MVTRKFGHIPLLFNRFNKNYIGIHSTKYKIQFTELVALKEYKLVLTMQVLVITF